MTRFGTRPVVLARTAMDSPRVRPQRMRIPPAEIGSRASGTDRVAHERAFRRLRLPNGHDAEIDPRKLTDYLLSPDHPTGREKARFFAAMGYTTVDAERLAAALLRIAEYERVVRFVQSDFGTTFVVDGTIKSATGSPIGLRTVWFLDRAGGRPRFVTAYPV